MRKGQFYARVLGPRLWSRFSAKVIRGQGAVRQAGPHERARSGGGRPVGPEGQEEPGRRKQLFGRWILVTLAFRYYYLLIIIT